MRSSIRSQRGVAAVELAIVLIPMLVLCFGITELGRALYQYNGLVKATRGAARYLSQQNLASPPANESAETIRRKTVSLALCGTIVCYDGIHFNEEEALVPGLKPEMIGVEDPVNNPGTHASVPTGEGTTSLVSVSVGSGGAPFQFTSIVAWVVPDITFGPVRITMASSTN